MAGLDQLKAVAAHLEGLAIEDPQTRCEVDAVAAQLVGIAAAESTPTDRACNSISRVEDTPKTILEAARRAVAAHRIGVDIREHEGRSPDSYARLVEPAVEALDALVQRHLHAGNGHRSPASPPTNT